MRWRITAAKYGTVAVGHAKRYAADKKSAASRMRVSRLISGQKAGGSFAEIIGFPLTGTPNPWRVLSLKSAESMGARDLAKDNRQN
jgi:hypothetical protein